MSVLLERREEDRIEFEERVVNNVQTFVHPLLNELRKTPIDEDQKTLLDEVEASLAKIVSSFSRELSLRVLALTPMEIRVADLVKEGMKNKAIARMARRIQKHHSHPPVQDQDQAGNQRVKSRSQVPPFDIHGRH